MRSIGLLLLAVVFSGGAAAQTSVSEIIQQRVELLLFGGSLEIEGVPIIATELVPTFYTERDFEPAWSRTDAVSQLAALVEYAYAEGLDRDDFPMEPLRALEARSTPEMAAEFDLLATETLIRAGYQLHFGKVDPRELDSAANFTRSMEQDRTASSVVEDVVSSDSIVGRIEQLLARGPFFDRLKELLAEYRGYAAAGRWPGVSSGPTLRRGDRGTRVAELQSRLLVTRDLRERQTSDPQLFDEALEQAVRGFQERHGLDHDGVVGAKTIEALNVPAQTRVDQLRLSLERARWVFEDIADKFVVVNIAGFTTALVQDREVVWSSRVVVGKTYRKTPVFKGDIEYLVLNPTWTVPPTILRKDVLRRSRRTGPT